MSEVACLSALIIHSSGELSEQWQLIMLKEHFVFITWPPVSPNGICYESTDVKQEHRHYGTVRTR